MPQRLTSTRASASRLHLSLPSLQVVVEKTAVVAKKWWLL